MTAAEGSRHNYGLNGTVEAPRYQHLKERDMHMQHLKLNAEDRRVYETWRRNVILLWAFIVGTMVIICTVLALDATVAPEQRVLLIQQSGGYP
jgi:hypothetical protein